MEVSRVECFDPIVESLDKFQWALPLLNPDQFLFQGSHQPFRVRIALEIEEAGGIGSWRSSGHPYERVGLGWCSGWALGASLDTNLRVSDETALVRQNPILRKHG